MNDVGNALLTAPHPRHSVPIDGLCSALNRALRGKSEVIEFVLA